MSKPTPNIADEIKRYLRTGDSDMDARAWPGDFMDRGRLQDADLRGALVEAVRRLAKGHSDKPVPANVGIEFTRAKVEPMVRGLFARAEQDVVLATFEKSVIYVTSDTFGSPTSSYRSDATRVRARAGTARAELPCATRPSILTGTPSPDGEM